MTFSLPNILLAVSQASLPAPTSTETPISAQLSAEAAALAGIANADAATAEASLQKIIIKGDFGTMDVVGQYNRGFIIARKRTSGADDLFIIDQHAADEKVNFETLQQTTNIQSQKLIQCVALPPSPRLQSLLTLPPLLAALDPSTSPPRTPWLR